MLWEFSRWGVMCIPGFPRFRYASGTYHSSGSQLHLISDLYLRVGASHRNLFIASCGASHSVSQSGTRRDPACR